MTAAIRHRRMMKPVDETRGAPHACRVENETIMQTYEALHVDEPPRDANGDVIEAGGYHGFHSFGFFYIVHSFGPIVRSFGPIVRSFGPIFRLFWSNLFGPIVHSMVHTLTPATRILYKPPPSLDTVSSLSHTPPNV